MAETATSSKSIQSLLQALTPLRERNFALLMTGRFTSNMGRSMRVFARAWLVLELTGSPFLMGVVTGSLALPEMIMPLYAGVVADRVDRRKLLLYTEFLLVVLWFVVSLDISLEYVKWWHLSLSAIVSGMIQSFGRTGHQAILGNVVPKEDLHKAVAIDSVVQHWPNIGGVLIATLLIGVIGVPGVFWLTVLGQLVTGITLLLMHWKYEAPAQVRKERNFQKDFIEGIKYIRGEPVLVGLVLIATTATLIGGATGFLMPIFARDILGAGARGLGVLQMSSTLGVSIGSLVLVSIVGNIPRRGLLLLAAVIIHAIFKVGFSQSEIFYLSVGLVFCMGLSNTVGGTMSQMLMQLMAPDHLRGRVLSLRVSIQGFSWIGVLAMGTLAEFAGAANTVLIGAIASGLASVAIFVLIPALRKFR